jgi:hypothetical protein
VRYLIEWLDKPEETVECDGMDRWENGDALVWFWRCGRAIEYNDGGDTYHQAGNGAACQPEGRCGRPAD